jgi:hypothetical protein
MLSTVRIVREAPFPGQLTDPVEIAKRSDERFAALRAALPATGVVGYIGGSGGPAVGHYYLAQYALAPLVLDDSPNHSLVIGNFPPYLPARAPSEKRELIKDFGDGVFLFANKDAK